LIIFGCDKKFSYFCILRSLLDGCNRTYGLLVISLVPRLMSGQDEHKFFPALLPSWYFAYTSLPRLPRVVICDLDILPLSLHLLSWLLVLAGAGRKRKDGW